jgi:N6-L-threonylcarbamoyladenine synthase
VTSLLVLAIETSCDDTAAAMVRGRFSADGSLESVFICSHVVESQLDSHIPFGGVVPEVAARDHLQKIDEVVQKALAGNAVPDLIAVTMGPGLVGALMVGILYARGFALARGIPLIAINHVDAHLAPALLLENFSLNTEIPMAPISFPGLALTISGGHCHLSEILDYRSRRVLGRTMDDACGEAFDKVAKLLGFPYPGGPQIEKSAKACSGARKNYPSIIADRDNRLNFSFSGVKTAVLNNVRMLTNHKTGKVSGGELSLEEKSAIAAGFQSAALGQLKNRIENAMQDSCEPYRSLFVAGGVAANGEFRDKLSLLGVPVRFAPIALCSDNATMIALEALLRISGKSDAKLQDLYNGFLRQPFTRYRDDEILKGEKNS